MKFSIGAKLSISFALVFAVLISLFSGVIYFLMSKDLERELMEDSLHDIEEVLLVFQENSWEKQIAEMPEESREFRLLIRVLDSGGNTIYLTEGVNPDEWPVDPDLLKKALVAPVWNDESLGDVSHLVLTRSFVPDGKPLHFLQIANSRVDNNLIKNQLIACINIGTLFILVVAVWGGVYLAKKALQPVEKIRVRAQNIKPQNLHERLVYDGPPDELYRLTETLNDLLARIQEAFKRLRTFTADASHELRIPLAGIRGTLEVGLRQNRSAEEAREIMETAYKESERMSELVMDLLALARSDAGEMKLEKTVVNLPEFFKHVYEEAKALNAENKVNIDMGSIPQGELVFDEVKIHQLLINLIENAIRYNKDHGQVTLTSEIKEKNLYIYVRDNGIGISEEDQVKVFDRFYRVDKARSREAGGTGLGLPIAKAIAEAHGGTISVKSVPRVGSEFILTLPI